MTIIWGYTPSATLSTLKKIGLDVKEAKQVFSALLFRAGIQGVSINIAEYTENTKVKIQLIIDSEEAFEIHFNPDKTGDHLFEADSIFYPKIEIEIVISVKDGNISLPLSSIGSGMGFQKQENQFVPTNHLGVGLITVSPGLDKSDQGKTEN